MVAGVYSVNGCRWVVVQEAGICPKFRFGGRQMDYGAGAINLRELLAANSASEDLDESSPLSAPDLHVLKDRLQVRSLQIKDRVHKYIISHYQDFSNIISRASDVASGVRDLSNNLQSILRLFDEEAEAGANAPIDVELCQLVAQAAKLKKHLTSKKETLVVVQTILALITKLESAQRNVEQGRLVEAAETLRDLRTELRIPENWRDHENRVSAIDSDPKAFILLKAQWISCFSKLQEMLEDMLHSGIQVDEENSKLYVNLRITSGKLPLSVDSVELSSVLTAMDIAGILDAGFARVADLIMKYVLVPVIHNAAVYIVSKDSTNGTDMNVRAVLSWATLPDLPNTMTEAVAPAALYSNLIRVVTFLHEHMCFKNGNWMKCLGRLIWPRLSDEVIAHCIAKAVPDEASEVAEFQNVLKLTRDFERELKDMIFISAADKKDDRLSTFALNVEVHFASKKKIHILARARRVLVRCNFTVSFGRNSGNASSQLQNDSNKDLNENGVELLFQPATCVISWAAKQLMEIVHEALKDACLSSVRIATEFYHAARDALLLYRAIIPVKLAKQLSIISEAAIIVHNDCLYLAQEILGLAFEYRANLPDHLKESAVFADLAPLFRQMAEESLNRQFQMVLFGLKEALDQANGFRNTHKKQQFEMASLAVDQVVFFLEKIRILWQPLLQPTIYKRSICSILQHVFARISSEILMLDDIAVEETLQLQRLIQTALENMSSLFKSVIDENTEKQESVQGFQKQDRTRESSWNQLEKTMSALCKLRRIADLLDMPLKSITLAWESGELMACSFTSIEVQKLIRAIFSDTPLRQECLRRIENSKFL